METRGGLLLSIDPLSPPTQINPYVHPVPLPTDDSGNTLQNSDYCPSILLHNNQKSPQVFHMSVTLYLTQLQSLSPQIFWLISGPVLWLPLSDTQTCLHEIKLKCNSWMNVRCKLVLLKCCYVLYINPTQISTCSLLSQSHSAAFVWMTHLYFFNCCLCSVFFLCILDANKV